MKAKFNFDGNWMPPIDLVFSRYTFNERVKRSLKSFLIFFIGAIFSILIPVLHFILVPLFLILSFILSFKKFRETKMIDLRSMNCPGCESNFNAGVISLKEEDSSLRLSCDSCRKSATLVFDMEAF